MNSSYRKNYDAIFNPKRSQSKPSTLEEVMLSMESSYDRELYRTVRMKDCWTMRLLDELNHPYRYNYDDIFRKGKPTR